MTLAARPWLEQIAPYRPGRHAASADGSLASNESAIGASPSIIAAVTAAAQRSQFYPDPLADELRSELAALHGVDPDQILVGNGSDELIFLLALAYLTGGGHVVCADPAYRIDEISTVVVGGRLTQVPLKDWTHDLQTMATVEADIAYVVNPHNPTGTVRSHADIEQFARESRAGLIVVDEAYIDFTDDPAARTAMDLVATGRVAVLRTFSKVHGLAGLRVGYLVAPLEVIATLRKIRAPFSVGVLAQSAAVAALRHPEHRDAVVGHTVRVRTEVAGLFERAGYEVVESQANFVLVVAPDEQDLVERLYTHGVSVRPGSSLGLPGTVRVSVPSDRGLELLDHALAGDLHVPALSGR
ncbi:pyridoxal phosphate-dependent aminotransferase [Segeticoccus rhizosphaerae]|uniref:pyridoxal phosphate-dependent aminotransferase n=1 Tax=Segeticoccus rhizosphaerae TaxID=1104777 RepID=UPI0010C0AE6A|nr:MULTISPECIES: histidinol-phosphate transaminase [Intrasporangiaceae]